MPLIKKTKYAGPIICEHIYESPTVIFEHTGGKSTAQDIYKNYKKSANNLNLTIALNFESGKSWFVTITLKGIYAKDINIAKKLIRKLKRFLNTYYKNQGLEFKTFGVLERGKKRTKRLHFHLLIPEITFAPLNRALREKFKGVFGCVYKKRFYTQGEDENVALAKYMLKNRLESDEFEVVCFRCNIQTPDVSTRKIKPNENPLNELIRSRKIKPPNGYSWNKKKTFLNDSHSPEPTGTVRYSKKQ